MMSQDQNRGEHRGARIAFFGTDPLAIPVLDALHDRGLTPALVVAGSDRALRNGGVTLPPEKSWALAHQVRVVQPTVIDDAFVAELASEQWDAFVVASYGKILPRTLLDIPRRGAINLHPSLLPRLRGPSPIRSAILNDEKEVGVSVMLLDDRMDHGPILAQEIIAPREWPPHGRELDDVLARSGASLLADTLPRWLDGSIAAVEQDHAHATYCKTFTREDGLLDLRDDARRNFLKIRALEGWPGTYAYFERAGEQIRVAILDAHMDRGLLIIDTVKPAGKNEMPYADFLRSGATPTYQSEARS